MACLLPTWCNDKTAACSFSAAYQQDAEQHVCC